MRNICLFFSFLFLLTVKGEAQDFGPNTKVSLITIGAGKDLYSKFGHSALRLYDVDSGLDLAYNYGTFDFNTPNFYPKFVRGKLDYIISVDRYAPLMRYYRQTGRVTYEQQLDLDSMQVQRIASFLKENLKPENVSYKYDFFYDNCATRLRDVLEYAFDGNLKYKEYENSDKVYRDLLIEKLDKSPLILLGINLILGPQTDRGIDVRGEMFLPEYLMDNMEAFASTDNAEGSFVGEKQLIFPDRSELKSIGLLQQPAFYVFLLLVITFLIYRQNTMVGLNRGLDLFMMALVSLICLLFVFMWVGTDHGTTYANWNLLWANPIAIYLFVSLLRKKELSKGLLKAYKALLLVGVIFLVLIPVVQELISRDILSFLQLPKHIPFQFFLLGLIALLYVRILNMERQKS